MLSSRGVQIVFARGVQNREIREKGGAKAVLGGCKRGAWGVQTISRGCNCINEYLFSQKSRHPNGCLLFCRRKGLEEGGHAEGGAKNMPVTCFLVRGRVHGSPTAAGRAVGGDPFLSKRDNC